MFKDLRGQVAPRTGEVRGLHPPRVVLGNVAFAKSHLAYAARDKLVKAHEGVRGYSECEVVVIHGGVVSFPVFHENVPCATL